MKYSIEGEVKFLELEGGPVRRIGTEATECEMLFWERIKVLEAELGKLRNDIADLATKWMEIGGNYGIYANCSAELDELLLAKLLEGKADANQKTN